MEDSEITEGYGSLNYFGLVSRSHKIDKANVQGKEKKKKRQKTTHTENNQTDQKSLSPLESSQSKAYREMFHIPESISKGPQVGKHGEA